MERTRPTFLGAVLKEIVCTPNANFDPDDYRSRVIEPVRQIRRMDEEVADADIPEPQRRGVMEILASVLEAKGVEPAEREERIADLARRFGLTGERRVVHGPAPAELVVPAEVALAQAAAG